MMHANQYRPEIDGLRAIAVVGVVLFHMGLPFAGGGFLGVDIFFVISGYVITALIDREIRQGRFSFGAFYERRIRRLLPPLIPVVVVTWFLAYGLFSAGQFTDFARSLRATILLSANWHFLSTVGYFDAPAATKPLLHFWSLAVEEQFYLVYPAVLLVLTRMTERWRSLLVALLALCSLGFCLWLTSTGQTDAAFFNSFARFWEIAAGSLIALLAVKTSSRAAATWLEIGSALTLLVLMNHSAATSEPVASSVVAVAGTALFIAADGNGPVSLLLRSRPFTAIGQISYALYLWHWPILVLIRTALPDAGLAWTGGGMLLAFALSALSFWTIERPFRARRWLPQRQLIYGLFVVASAGFFVLSAADYVPGISRFKSTISIALRDALYGPRIGAALFALDDAGAKVAKYDKQYDGNAGPYDKGKYAGWTCSYDNGNSVDRIVDCLTAQTEDFNVVVLGDSVGRDTFHALQAAYPNTNIMMLHQSSCPPADVVRAGIRCFADLATVLQRFAANANLSVVVLAYRYLPDTWASVDSTLTLARRLTPNVALFALSPVFKRTVSEMLRDMPRGAPVLDAVSKDDRTKLGWDLDAIGSSARSLATAQGAAFVDIEAHFCPGQSCPLWISDDDTRPIFWDAQHLSLDGIISFAEYLRGNRTLAALLAH